MGYTAGPLSGVAVAMVIASIRRQQERMMESQRREPKRSSLDLLSCHLVVVCWYLRGIAHLLDTHAQIANPSIESCHPQNWNLEIENSPLFYLSLTLRPISRFNSLSLMTCLLSYFFFPLATPISILI